MRLETHIDYVLPLLLTNTQNIEDLEVAEAIDEHWMPRGEKSPLPQTPSGMLVSLADKIDNFL